jgi:hypothetical protein
VCSTERLTQPFDRAYQKRSTEHATKVQPNDIQPFDRAFRSVRQSSDNNRSTEHSEAFDRAPQPFDRALKSFDRAPQPFDRAPEAFDRAYQKRSTEHIRSVRQSISEAFDTQSACHKRSTATESHSAHICVSGVATERGYIRPFDRAPEAFDRAFKSVRHRARAISVRQSIPASVRQRK